MLDQQFDEQLRGCVPNGTGSRRCPPSPTGGTSSPPETCTPTSTRPSPSERGAWLTSHGFVVDATKKQVSVIQGDVRGTVRLG